MSLQNLSFLCTIVFLVEMTDTKITLGNAGYVELLEVFGSDLTVVNAARVSFAKESHEFSEQDGKLVKYLAKHNHISPFFHPQIHMRLKMPIFVAREWFRHQIGFARNEVSRRYVDAPPECYIPEPEAIRARDPKLKQGSKSEPVEDAEFTQQILKDSTTTAMTAYSTLLARGVAPEIARMVLPQSMYTEFVETGSLAAYARLCNLRLDLTAQKEIRDYADAVVKLLEPRFPVSWKALIHTPPE
jgi:thymidylate synthase (FAD)